MHVVHTDDRRRLALLVTPERAHLGARNAGFGAARVPVGHDAVRHRDTGVGHRRDRSRPAEVDVVGMGHDHEDTVDAVEAEPFHRARR